jgi:hypothetical protein
MAPAPTDAPWSLRGEAVVAFCGGRTVMIGERYDASPVGPFLMLGVARMSRVGLRIGLRFSTMVVNNHDRLAAGRRNWGMPGELGTLSWASAAGETVLVWHERNIELRARPRGRGFPLYAPGRLVQRRADGPVVVPTRVRGRARSADAEVIVPDEDERAPLAGRRRAVVITGMAMKLLVARRPAGSLWSALAPSPAEPDTAIFGRTRQ